MDNIEQEQNKVTLIDPKKSEVATTPPASPVTTLMSMLAAQEKENAKKRRNTRGAFGTPSLRQRREKAKRDRMTIKRREKAEKAAKLKTQAILNG